MHSHYPRARWYPADSSPIGASDCVGVRQLDSAIRSLAFTTGRPMKYFRRRGFRSFPVDARRSGEQRLQVAPALAAVGGAAARAACAAAFAFLLAAGLPFAG